ncbi:MAG TPA: hypothetical protein VJQ56_06485 [Blastocatellia bacterium]|nr:hypothetical protein [Blastocatellia bacterium]
MSFDEIFKGWNWEPIRNCPGRFALRGAKAELRPEEIIGHKIETIEFQVVGAKDAVIVARLEGGGLISYRREDGSFLHTLNTPEGFCRKLEQLGINLRDDSIDLCE